MTIFYIVSGILLIACFALLILLSGAKQQQAALGARLAAAEQTASQAGEKEGRITELTEKLVRSESRVQALEEREQHQRQELEKLQASFRLEFRNLANEILEEKSVQFSKSNKQAMDTLLGPFKTSISEFRERVEKIYSEENHQRGALQNEIKNLLDLNRRITEETTNLTNALRGNSKVQGDWGEMILQTILENSNLIHGIHYTTQENLKDEASNNLRPDVILQLPGEKQIVIDSKVSLTAFVNYCSEDDAARREGYLKEHLLSFRRHVDELGSKRYQNLVNSPDFVIMFVPNEPAFMCALQNDSEIWNDAYRKKVIVSSPTNLFALLKIVDDLWKRDNQSRNALEIAEEGSKMYDKFVGFIETLETIGKSIGSAQAGYDRAMTQLKTGSGNLIARTEKLRRLGVKASKTLPPKMTSEPEEEEE